MRSTQIREQKPDDYDDRKKMIGKYQINGRGYHRCCFAVEYQINILKVLDVHEDPLINTKEADVVNG